MRFSYVAHGSSLVCHVVGLYGFVRLSTCCVLVRLNLRFRVIVLNLRFCCGCMEFKTVVVVLNLEVLDCANAVTLYNVCTVG